MSSGEDAIEYIESILSSIGKKVEASSEIQEIEKIIGTNIHDAIKNFIGLGNKLTEEIDIFNGYELENEKSLLQQYLDALKQNSCSFFAGNFVDQNFQASEDCGISYYDEYGNSPYYKENDEINNLKLIVPLFRASGAFYIVLNLGGEQPGELLAVSQDYSFNVFAPSLEDHLNDLIHGLKNGSYIIEDDDFKTVQYPMSWGARKLVTSGEYYLDEYDELQKK